MFFEPRNGYADGLEKDPAFWFHQFLEAQKTALSLKGVQNPLDILFVLSPGWRHRYDEPDDPEVFFRILTHPDYGDQDYNSFVTKVT